MSLLDNILGAVIGNNASSDDNNLQSNLLRALISQLMGGDQKGGGMLGNILDGMLGGGDQKEGSSSGLGGLLGGASGALGGMLGSLLGGSSKVQSQAGTQVAGGLEQFIDSLKNAGLGEQVQSWMGNGENLPVSAEQLQNILGPSGFLSNIASKANVSEAEAAGGLIDLLPALINKLTPNGQIDAGDIGGILGSLLGGNKS